MEMSSCSSARSPNSRSRCKYKMLVRTRTSWTWINHGRRFNACPNSQDRKSKCNFFEWIDPEVLNDWYKETIYDLYLKSKRTHETDDLDATDYKVKMQELEDDIGYLFQEFEDNKKQMLMYKKLILCMLAILCILVGILILVIVV